MVKKFWNETTEIRLTELVKMGVSARIIAHDLKITRNMVIGKCNRMGLKITYVQPQRINPKFRKTKINRSLKKSLHNEFN